MAEPAVPGLDLDALVAHLETVESALRTAAETIDKLTARALAAEAEKEKLSGIAEAYAACESVARKRVDHIDPALEERLPALCEISRETWLAHKERAPIMAVDMLHYAQLKAAEAALAGERERVAKVLEPFDDALGEDDEGYGDGLTVVMKWGACTDYSVTLGDLRDIRKLAAANRAQGE